MTETGHRIRKAINWLIFQEIVDSDTDLAEKLGYKKASISQIINGKVPVSEKFVRNLCSLDENINSVWILTGEGTLLNTAPTAPVDKPNGELNVSIPQPVWAVIEAQAQSLAARDRQVEELIALLRDEIAELKKIHAQQGGAATSVAVG